MLPPRSTVEYPISRRHNPPALTRVAACASTRTPCARLLADAWERWARRCAELTPQQWSTATRCRPWDVRGLVAHLCPDRAMFDMLTAAATDGPAAVTEAAEMLRRFNAPGGIAHTSADDIAERATSDATTLTPDDAVTRFTECAEILRATPMSKRDGDLLSGSRHHDIGGRCRGRVDGGDRAPARPGRRGRRCPDRRIAPWRRRVICSSRSPTRSRPSRSLPAGPIRRLRCRRSGDSRHTVHSELTAAQRNKVSFANVVSFRRNVAPPLPAICSRILDVD